MRVAVLLAGLAAAYATNDAAAIDKTVGPEIKQYLRHKECVLNDASEAYAKAAEEDPSACPALYKVYRAAEKDYKSTERIINLQGEPMCPADARKAFEITLEAHNGFDYAEDRCMFQAMAGKEPRMCVMDCESRAAYETNRSILTQVSNDRRGPGLRQHLRREPRHH